MNGKLVGHFRSSSSDKTDGDDTDNFVDQQNDNTQPTIIVSLLKQYLLEHCFQHGRIARVAGLLAAAVTLTLAEASCRLGATTTMSGCSCS